MDRLDAFDVLLRSVRAQNLARGKRSPSAKLLAMVIALDDMVQLSGCRLPEDREALFAQRAAERKILRAIKKNLGLPD